jgi:hypothetical protein
VATLTKGHEDVKTDLRELSKEVHTLSKVVYGAGAVATILGGILVFLVNKGIDILVAFLNSPKPPILPHP